MENASPIDGTSQTASNMAQPQGERDHSLLIAINIILFLGVIACACACTPLSQGIKNITTFAGIGVLIVIDAIYCGVIYAYNKNKEKGSLDPLVVPKGAQIASTSEQISPNKEFSPPVDPLVVPNSAQTPSTGVQISPKKEESSIPPPLPPPALPKCALSTCDPSYLEFLTKAGLQNVNGKFPRLELTFSAIDSYQTLIPEIRRKLIDRRIPEKGIMFVRGQDSKLRLYLPTIFRLFTPVSSDIVEMIYPSNSGTLDKFDIKMSYFDQEAGAFKNVCDAVKKFVATEQQGAV